MATSDDWINVKVPYKQAESPKVLTNLCGSLRTLGGLKLMTERRKDVQRAAANNSFHMSSFVENGLLKEDSNKYLHLKDNIYRLSLAYLHGESIPPERINLCGYYLAWVFYIDDLYDTLSYDQFPEGGLTSIIKANNVWLNILKGTYGNTVQVTDLPSIEGYPAYEPISRLTIHLQEMLLKLVPDLLKSTEFHATLAQAFSAMEFKLGYPHALLNQETSFLHFHRVGGAGWNMLLLYTHMLNVRVPNSLQNHACFDIIKSNVENITAAGSDIFGINKDIQDGDKDSYIVFKMNLNCSTPQEAFAYVVEFFNSNVNELAKWIDLLTLQYKSDMEMQKFLMLIPKYLDACILWASECQRYNSHGN